MNVIGNESSLKVPTNYDCNHADCKYKMVAACDNWLRHLRQSESDSFDHCNDFDSIYGVKKRCKKCVDK